MNLYDPDQPNVARVVPSVLKRLRQFAWENIVEPDHTARRAWSRLYGSIAAEWFLQSELRDELEVL